MILFFVTPPDTTNAAGETVESDPLLRSGAVRAEDCWTNLANARQRLTGEPCNAEELKAKMTADGYRVLKYDAKPANV